MNTYSRKIRSSIPHLQQQIDDCLSMIVADAGFAEFWETRQDEGWRAAITNTERGFCHYTARTITVPLWAFQKGTEYFHYYVAHELAHVLNHHYYKTRGHGPSFQAFLIRLTPYVKYELAYKPRLAVAAGITRSMGT